MNHHDKNEVIAKMKGMWGEFYLSHLGWTRENLSKKHGSCPNCGGRDRFRFTDELAQEKGNGAAICNQCGNDSGVGWVMKCSGMSYSETIDALGDWLNLVPIEVVAKANKRASRTSPYKMGSQIDHEKCWEIMLRTEVVESTPLSIYEGIYSEFGFDVGRTKSGELIHAVPCFMAYSDGISEEMCNVMFINEEGNVSYAAKDYTRQSVSVIGSFKDDEYAYLVDNFIDGNHVHIATGNRCVLVCHSSYNMEMVAYALRNYKLRVACSRNDFDLLAVADDRNLDVVMPNDDNFFKSGIRKRIYKASELLD